MIKISFVIYTQSLKLAYRRCLNGYSIRFYMSVLEAYTDRIVTPQATNFRFEDGFSKRASEFFFNTKNNNKKIASTNPTLSTP